MVPNRATHLNFPNLLKNLLLAHFGIILYVLGNIRIFPENQTLSLLNLYSFLTSCTISRKTKDWIPRKVHYGSTEGKTAKQTDLNSLDLATRWELRNTDSGSGYIILGRVKTYVLLVIEREKSNG